MGSRALRKLQREQLEQKLAASQPEQDEAESEEEEVEEPVVTSQPKNAFDLLEGMGDNEEEEDSDEDQGAPLPTQPSEPVKSHATPAKSKKKKKKQKKKQKDASDTPALTESKDASEDEIDKALKELSLKNGNQLQDESGPVHEEWEERATQYLAIDQKNLDPVNEMRGLFGNIALEESASRPQPTRQREQNLQGGVDLATSLTAPYSPVARGKKLGALAKRRNCLLQGKEDWPLATSGGLSMEALPPSSFERKYNLVHNQQYKESQWDFRIAVESMQMEGMISHLVRHPYHVGSLLQVSEIAKYQGDSSLSGDLLEKALFTIGRSVHSSFPAATRSGTARLSFDKPANRDFYLTIWRYIRNLEQRGTWKTAFEWSKLLLQFNTLSDPYGVTLMIDQLALRGRQHDQFLQLASDEAYGPAWSHLPNIQISKTLALLRAQRPKEARQQLAKAIHHYPYILAALASAIEVTPIPKALWGKTPSTDPEKLYTELYVTRAKDLWNTPETIGLISEVANTLQYYKSYVDQQPAPPPLQISLEEARHIMALETPALIALLPRNFRNMPTSSSDILPPPSSEQIEQNDLTARAPAGAPTNGGANRINLMGLFERMYQWLARPSESTPAQDAAGQEPRAQDLNELRQFLGPDAQALSDDMLTELYAATAMHEGLGIPLGGDDATFDERVARMPGGFDIRRMSTSSEGTDGEMPELEDTQEPRRGPHAATVEEDEDEDMPVLRPPNNDTASLAPILRRADDDDAAGEELSAARSQPATVTAAQPTTTTPAPPAQTDTEIEADPQRLQRWLISTGLEDLKDGNGTSLYVKRLKMLNKNQQTWILGMVRQRGSAELMGRVEGLL